MALDIDQVSQSALKFKHSSDWRAEYPSHYKWAARNKVLPVTTRHMSRKPVQGSKKYTKEFLQERAKLFNTRKEFGQNDRKHYVAACRYGIMDQICGHMESYETPFDRKMLYVLEDKSSIYIGITSGIKKRFAEHHVLKNMDLDTLKVRVTKAYPVEIVCKAEKKAVAYAKANLDKEVLNKDKGGAIGSRLKYTYKDLLETAQSCSTVREFRLEHPLRYKAAQMRKLLPSITKGLEGARTTVEAKNVR